MRTLKTFYSERSIIMLERKTGLGYSEFFNSEVIDREEDTGVKWVWGFISGGVSVMPVDRGQKARDLSEESQEIILDVYENLKDSLGFVSYFNISELAGIELPDIMSQVLSWEKQGLAKRTVNRMGYCEAFKIVVNKTITSYRRNDRRSFAFRRPRKIRRVR